MPPKKPASRERLLTETELELMTILWKLEGGTVNDVLARLPPTRKLAYTSVSTMLRILEQKGFATSRKEGRGHVYEPVLSRERYEATSLNHLVTKVFDGEKASLVRRLLESEGLTSDELGEIRTLIDEKLRPS